MATTVLLVSLVVLFGLACASNDPAGSATPEGSSAHETDGAVAVTSLTPAERQARAASLSRQGRAELQAGRLREALRHFREVLELDPGRARTWVQLAAVHAKRGEKADALKALEQAAKAGFLDFEALRELDKLQPLDGYAPFEDFLEQREHFATLVAQRQLDFLEQRLGEEYAYRLDPEMRLIVATDRPQWVIDAITENLALTAKALWDELFEHQPHDYLAVLIPNRDDFQRLLSFSGPSDIGGVYIPERRLLIAREPDYMLRHEYIHFLHFADLEHFAQRQNIWFLEGLATLFENSAYTVGGEKIVPVPNSRQNLLRRLAAREQLSPWRELMAADPETFMEQAAELYAQARYICWWLWEQDKLAEYHAAYAANVAEDPTGIEALEEVLGVPLEEAQTAWQAWVDTELRYFHGVAEPNRGYLGLNLEASREHGVTIAGIREKSPAAATTLQVGDRLVRIGPRRVITTEDLIDELIVRKPGEHLKLTIERDGEELAVELELGEAPRPEELPEPDLEQPRADPR